MILNTSVTNSHLCVSIIDARSLNMLNKIVEYVLLNIYQHLSFHCIFIFAMMCLLSVLTVPQLLIRSINAEIAEATFKDMLDTILGAGALLHLLHPVSAGYHRKKNCVDFLFGTLLSL